MGIEEKAKAYDEALEKARARYDKEPTDGYVGYANQILKELFPTLAESEDERIRKELIEYLRGDLDDITTDDTDRWINWIEKQKDCILVPKSHLDPVGKLGVDGMKILEKQKEQKHVETSDFKTKLAEYLQNNSPKDGKYVISSESILEMAKEELLKRGELQKPVELNEKDRKILDDVSHILAGLNYKQVAQDYKQAVENLLSLRPQWKPSEEQMKALQNAVALTACDKELARLYNQLKNL